MDEITYFNRYTQRLEQEKVLGGHWVKWFYGHNYRRHHGWMNLAAGHLLSKLYGMYMNSARSKHLIPPFVQDYAINLNEFEAEDFANFNQFFIRRFKPQARSWVTGKRLAAPCQARYLAYATNLPDNTYPVKGEDLAPQLLLRDNPWASYFMNGPILIARLCPVDYHRFHYSDAGRVMDHFVLPGRLHSVNPWALRAIPQLFAGNEKHVTIIQTENFGYLAMIEVGALGVGKIVQTNLGPEIERGAEKGHFLFGGSTVIILGEPQRWKPSDDLLTHTACAQETLVNLGDEVAVALN